MRSIVDVATDSLQLVGALIAGAAIAMAIERVRATLRRRRWEAFKRSRPNDGRSRNTNVSILDTTKPVPVSKAPTDTVDQLRIVMSASFSAQPLLNRGEARVFRELEAIVAARNPRWLVMAQVSLGEILRSKDSEAYSCINSKRVDLLLADEDCQPRHVVEYQGAGHNRQAAAARDAVKKEALRRAGIGYHEVIAGQTTPSDLKRLVSNLVEGPPLGREETSFAEKFASRGRGSTP